MTAIEMSATVDDQRHLNLDDLLPISGPRRVRVIVMYPRDDPNETEWLEAVARNPAFDFLNEPEEDIYSLHDWKPFYDKK